MKCPRCSVIVGHRSPTCHGCGFSLVDLSAVYGDRCVQMERLHDDAHCLLKNDRSQVQAAMDSFERRFPQLFFACYLSQLPEQARLPELGFWLLNYAAILSVDIDRPNENAVLLVIDPQARRAQLSLGYFAEQLLEDVHLERALATARPWFANGDYGTAIVAVVRQLGKALSRRSRELRRRPPEACESLLNPFGRPQLPELRAVKTGQETSNASA